MDTPRILVVDDEKTITDLVGIYLRNEGFDVTLVYNGADAARLILEREFDLAVLDIMLPDVDGFELLRTIRAERTYPVIMLTARDGQSDKIEGLTLGADDYMVKPFDVLELLARVEGVLRRHGKLQTVIQVGDLEINTVSMQVTSKGKLLNLTRKEYELLLLFAQNVGAVLSKSTIYQQVWGGEYPESTRTVELHIQRMKKKVGWDDKLKSVYGVGYRLEE